jgi:hypothetical protein
MIPPWSTREVINHFHSKFGIPLLLASLPKLATQCIYQEKDHSDDRVSTAFLYVEQLTLWKNLSAPVRNFYKCSSALVNRTGSEERKCEINHTQPCYFIYGINRLTREQIQMGAEEERESVSSSIGPKGAKARASLYVNIF